MTDTIFVTKVVSLHWSSPTQLCIVQLEACESFTSLYTDCAYVVNDYTRPEVNLFKQNTADLEELPGGGGIPESAV